MVEMNNLALVAPIPSVMMLAHVNRFVMDTAGFLDSFSARCQTKLEEQLKRIQKLEAAITLLEKKLDSVPELRSLQVDENPPTTPEQTTPSLQEPLVQPPTSSQPLVQPPLQPPMASQPASTEVEVAAPEELTPADNRHKVSEDPRYSKYFKMVRLGVPVQAVKLKMRNEGVADPDVLDDPEALVAGGEEVDSSEDSEEDSFSD